MFEADTNKAGGIQTSGSFDSLYETTVDLDVTQNQPNLLRADFIARFASQTPLFAPKQNLSRLPAVGSRDDQIQSHFHCSNHVDR
jgi:hypothetical protein